MYLPVIERKKISGKNKLRKSRIETLTLCTCIKALPANWLDFSPYLRLTGFIAKQNLVIKEQASEYISAQVTSYFGIKVFLRINLTYRRWLEDKFAWWYLAGCHLNWFSLPFNSHPSSLYPFVLFCLFVSLIVCNCFIFELIWKWYPFLKLWLSGYAS